LRTSLYSFPAETAGEVLQKRTKAVITVAVLHHVTGEVSLRYTICVIFYSVVSTFCIGTSWLAFLRTAAKM
jgi:hypothetical protein